MLLVININLNYFPYLHAIMFAFILFTTILEISKQSLKILLLFTFIIALTPVLVMMLTKHPLPLGDDARFIGFAKTIADNNRWVPFKYKENSYYQFFHLIPYVEYILATIPGFTLKNIATYYLVLKICLYFTYLTFIYLLVTKLTGSKSSSLVAMLLLSITPPLAFSQVTHQRYAIVIFLTTSFLLSQRFKLKKLVIDYLTIVPLVLTGIVAHATYTVMIIAFLIPIIVARIYKASDLKGNIIKFLILLISISLTYWIYVYVLDIIVRPSVDAISRLVDLLTGRTLLFSRARRPWYTSKESNFFIAWALIPSIISSYLLFSIINIIFRKRENLDINPMNDIVILGILGLVGTVINYLLRGLPTFGGRYFYWLYLLMIPLSALVIRKTSKNLLSLFLSLAIISSVSFYGVQDLTLSGNTYGERIWWADLNSWTAAKHISPFLESSYTIKWIEGRISAPLSALRKPASIASEKKCRGVFIIVGMDNLGLYSILKSPHFPVKQLNVNTKSIPGLSVVLNIYKFRGIWIAKP